MRKLTIAAIIGVFPASVALAQTPMLTDVDTDANGTLSMAELQVAYPSLTEEGFTAIDANGDGAVDRAEFTAAVEAGVLTSG